MESLSLAVTIVFPLFSMMVLGYLLKVLHILDETFLIKLNKLCFKVFLPLLLFINIYQSDFSKLFSPKLVTFAVTLVLVTFFLLLLIMPVIENKNKNRGVLIQGILRSNYILFGIPIAIGLYGIENVGTTAIIIAFIIPLFNFLSVLALSIYSDKKQTKKEIITEVFKNPLIVASIIAIIFVVTKIKLPNIVENTIIELSLVATPLALVTLGGSFQFRSINLYKKQLILAVIGKLVIIPTILISISILFGYRGLELAALMALFVSPTALSTFTMAQNANANDKLAGQIVVVSSILSVVTIFLWIVIMKYFSLI